MRAIRTLSTGAFFGGHLRRGALVSALAAGLLAAGCSSGSSSTSDDDGSGPGADIDSFAVLSTSVLSGAVWKLNRPIDITFNRDVDFDTVGFNTIQILDTAGQAALGTFTLVSPRVVRFQPRCPTNDDNSDGGFKKNRTYTLTVVSTSTNAVTVLDSAGESLEIGISVRFTTPDSDDPLQLFIDTVAGPPNVRVRGLNGVPLDDEDSSYVEFGGDPDDIEYFQLDLVTQTGRIPSMVPLNYYSRADERFAIVLRFNQPVVGSSENISNQRITLEYNDNGLWRRMPTSVALIGNCTGTGASVRVEPQGIVPQGAQIRVNLKEGFEDLTGDAIQSDLTTFARMTSEQVNNPGTGDPTQGSDEVLAQFVASGNEPGSLENIDIASPKPRADWGGGTLSASFEFGGTGGPGGDFDWVIRAGQTISLDTNATQIRGGPNGAETTTQTVIDGVVDVRNMTVEAGGTLIITGPNTCTILASGFVRIDGVVSLNGGNNPGVVTLNTTNQPEEGAPGQAGGGNGGTGSFLTSQSTPKGGDGFGAFQRANLGGEGGETSFRAGNKERRRGSGGGGGRLGKDVIYFFDDPGGSAFDEFVHCQTLIGLDAEPGFDGAPDGMGAISQTTRAVGGEMAPFPFLDQNEENDFFGTMLTQPDNQLVIGELSRIWAGSGGGAGGDAVQSNSFPLTPFTITGDEKGSGGGGGAGGIRILAIGEIRISSSGQLTANGGYGGGGENSLFFDRLGGGGGGGSGGHIVLSSAAQIVVEAEVPEGNGNGEAATFYNDNPASFIHSGRPLSAVGGQGGCGRENRCGANEDGQTSWRCDGMPDRFNGNQRVPPQPCGQCPTGNNNNCWENCNDGSPDPPGSVVGGGGDGGPGIIQLHVADPATQLLFPNRTGTYGVDLDPTFSCAPPPLGWKNLTDPADLMIPFFGDESESVSEWLPLGLARRNPDGSIDQVELSFAGTNPGDGSIVRNGTQAQELPPAIPFDDIFAGSATPPFLAGDGVTFVLDATALDDIYKANAALTREFIVRLQPDGTPAQAMDFIVQSASYDAGTDTLSVTVDPDGEDIAALLTSFAGAGGDVALIPNAFRLLTNGVLDNYPANTEVRILFDATLADPLTGLPRENLAFSGGDLQMFAPDITALNAQNWDFFRFKVEFDLDVASIGVNLSTPRPGLDFVRVPFRF